MRCWGGKRGDRRRTLWRTSGGIGRRGGRQSDYSRATPRPQGADLVTSQGSGGIRYEVEEPAGRAYSVVVVGLVDKERGVHISRRLHNQLPYVRAVGAENEDSGFCTDSCAHKGHSIPVSGGAGKVFEVLCKVSRGYLRRRGGTEAAYHSSSEREGTLIGSEVGYGCKHTRPIPRHSDVGPSDGGRHRTELLCALQSLCRGPHGVAPTTVGVICPRGQRGGPRCRGTPSHSTVAGTLLPKSCSDLL